MNKSIVAIAVAGLVGGVGVSSVASAMEFSVYGSLRAGVYQKDSDDTKGSDAAERGAGVEVNPVVSAVPADDVKGRDAWDFGTGNAGSRIGIRGSEDLGNGTSAGFHIEYGTDTGTTARRHENVWLQGGWGKLTLGQQSNPYRNAANWDQSWFIGGQNRYGATAGTSRPNGIRYDSNLSGPFSFSVMATADNADSADDGYDVSIESDATGANATLIDVTTPDIKDEDGIDSFIVAAHFAVGDVATVNVGFITDNVEGNEPGESYDNAVISANGSAGPLDWYVAYEENDDNLKSPDVDATMIGVAGTGTATAATIAAASNYVNQVYQTTQDAETIGVFLGWHAGERDVLYLEYEDSSVDGANTDLEGLDKDALLLGYSHRFGPATTFIVEYLTVDTESDYSADSDTFIAALKVDF